MEEVTTTDAIASRMRALREEDREWTEDDRSYTPSNTESSEEYGDDEHPDELAAEVADLADLAAEERERHSLKRSEPEPSAELPSTPSSENTCNNSSHAAEQQRLLRSFSDIYRERFGCDPPTH